MKITFHHYYNLEYSDLKYVFKEFPGRDACLYQILDQQDSSGPTDDVMSRFIRWPFSNMTNATVSFLENIRCAFLPIIIIQAFYS